MTEFKYCVYCEDEPAICFNTEAEAMKFAREDTSMYNSVRVEKSEINEAGEVVNTEVIWTASGNNIPEKDVISDNEFDTDFPESDIASIDISDDIDYDEIARQYEEDPADWIDDNKLIREAVDALEENEDEVECKVCFELGPKAEMKKLDIGYVCPKCAQELQSHQGTNLDLIDNDPFSLDYEDPRDFDEPEETEVKEEPVNANEVRKHEAGIEEKLNEDVMSLADQVGNRCLDFWESQRDIGKWNPQAMAEYGITDPEEYADYVVKNIWTVDDIYASIKDKVQGEESEVKKLIDAWMHDSLEFEVESLKEHINDRPADIESDQVLQGTDNAVVNCKTDQKVIVHSEDEKPLDCKMEKPALEEPLAGEEVDVKLNEELKVIIDFSEYKPWSGAVDTYELIKDADKLDELEAYLEECYPDGVTATQINDILWFDSDQVLSYLGLGDVEDEEVDECLKEEVKEVPWTVQWTEDSEPSFIGFAANEDALIDQLVKNRMSDSIGEMTTFDQLDKETYLDMKKDNELDEDEVAELDKYFGITEDLVEAKKDEELPVDPEAAKLEVHTMLNDLVADEIEAINGYEEAKKEILDTPIAHKDNILDTIDHVEDEEKEHVDELIAATTEIPFDKEEAPAPVEKPVSEDPFDQDFPEVEEELTESTLTEGPHLKSTWLDSVYGSKKYFIFKKIKGKSSFEKDEKEFSKINDAIKYATELSKKTDIIATSIRSDNKTFIIAENGKITKSYINDLVNDIKTDAKLSKLGKSASKSSTDELEDELDKTDGAETEATKIIIKFNANGGSGTAEDIEANKGDAATLPECKFTAPEGKTFKTWEVNGIERAVGTKLTFDEDTEIKAIWEDSIKATDSTDTTGKEASKETHSVDKKNEARKRYARVIKALQDAGYNVSDLRDGKKVTPKLKELVKAIFTESYADTPFDSDIKEGDKIRIIHLEGEDNSYDGKEGEVTNIDSIGQLHGTWGGLAVIPGVDDFDIITEDLTEAKAKPEGDKVKSYNDGLKLAKLHNKPVIYGYTNSSYGNKFFELDDPIICDNVSDETKKFKQQYKSCNVVYVAYPSGQLIERLLEELPEGTTEIDYVEYKHSYCHALEPKLEELKKIEDIEELKKAILDIINNDPQVNWTKKEKKFAAIVRHKKWKSVEDLKAYLDNSIAKAREIKVSVDADGELVKKLTEEIEVDENGDEIFTPEEQEEFDCDEWGYSNEGYDQFHHCGWCGEIYPESEMRHEVDFGWICSRCEDELKSHGGPLTFIED